MDRIIKFRGQNINGDWNYGLLCHDASKDTDYEWFISNKSGKPYAFGCIEKTIGQYTGLKDKNGLEIYEGILLKYFIIKTQKIMQEIIFNIQSIFV